MLMPRRVHLSRRVTTLPASRSSRRRDRLTDHGSLGHRPRARRHWGDQTCDNVDQGFGESHGALLAQVAADSESAVMPRSARPGVAHQLAEDCRASVDGGRMQQRRSVSIFFSPLQAPAAGASARPRLDHPTRTGASIPETASVREPLPLTSDSSASVRSVRAATPSHVIRGSLLTHRTLATCGDYQGDPAAVGQAARTPTRAAQPGPWSPPCPPSSHTVRASAPAPRDSALRSAGRATETSPPNRRAR